MQIKGRDVDKVDEELLLSMVKDGTTEDRHLDYKEKLDLSTDAQKKEFLADVTSFANAAGGVLIYGMREKDKVAVELPGIVLDQPDSVEAKINSVIMSGTDPRIPGYQIRVVPLASERHAIVIGIASSWMGPHMIAYQSKQNTRFYSRTSNGKYALDVTELRNAFLMTESKREQIQQFRDGRLAKIVANEGPVRLSGSIRSILHVVPFSAADPTFRLDLDNLRPGGKAQDLYRLSWQNFRPSFEGFLFVGAGSPNGVGRYLQVFRNGAIEAVLSDESVAPFPQLDLRQVPMGIFEGYARSALIAALGTYRQLGVESPVFVMYALCGVRGTVIATQRSMFDDGNLVPLNSDVLVVQERLLQMPDASVDALLHPMFDEVWNASGYPGSPRWSPDHEWLGGPNLW